jgi:hypothetical protein
MMNLLTRRCAFASLLLALPAAAQSGSGSRRLGAGQIAYQYVGRVNIDFTKGTGTVFGYVTQFAGLPAASLFNGTPGESTALLTFHAEIAIQPLPGNGDLGPNTFAVLPVSVVPGPFRFYFNTNPTRSWNNPAAFASGTLVGDFLREGEQFSLIGPIGTNTASAVLESSVPFTIGSVEVNFRRLLRNGVTNITTGNNAPVPGSTPVSPIFAFAGYALAIGD